MVIYAQNYSCRNDVSNWHFSFFLDCALVLLTKRGLVSFIETFSFFILLFLSSSSSSHPNFSHPHSPLNLIIISSPFSSHPYPPHIFILLSSISSSSLLSSSSIPSSSPLILILLSSSSPLILTSSPPLILNFFSRSSFTDREQTDLKWERLLTI